MLEVKPRSGAALREWMVQCPARRVRSERGDEYFWLAGCYKPGFYRVISRDENQLVTIPDDLLCVPVDGVGWSTAPPSSGVGDWLIETGRRAMDAQGVLYRWGPAFQFEMKLPGGREWMAVATVADVECVPQDGRAWYVL